MTEEKTVVSYPIFASLCMYTFDSFWKDIFLECSRNNFPKGSKYDSKRNTLFLRKEGKQKGFIPISLPIEDPPQTFRVLFDAFKNILGLRSPTDIAFQNDEIKKVSKTRVVTTDVDEWKQIRSKSVKDRLLFDYLCTLVKTHSLNLRQRKQLFSVVSLGFASKKITSAEVVFEDRNVVGINGLEWNDELGKFTLDGRLGKASTSRSVTKKENDAFRRVACRYVKDELARNSTFKA